MLEPLSFYLTDTGMEFVMEFTTFMIYATTARKGSSRRNTSVPTPELPKK